MRLLKAALSEESYLYLSGDFSQIRSPGQASLGATRIIGCGFKAARWGEKLSTPRRSENFLACSSILGTPRLFLWSEISGEKQLHASGHHRREKSCGFCRGSEISETKLRQLLQIEELLPSVQLGERQQSPYVGGTLPKFPAVARVREIMKVRTSHAVRGRAQTSCLVAVPGATGEHSVLPGGSPQGCAGRRGEPMLHPASCGRTARSSHARNSLGEQPRLPICTPLGFFRCLCRVSRCSADPRTPGKARSSVSGSEDRATLSRNQIAVEELLRQGPARRGDPLHPEALEWPRPLPRGWSPRAGYEPRRARDPPDRPEPPQRTLLISDNHSVRRIASPGLFLKLEPLPQ